MREKRNKEKDNIIQSSVNCSNTCIWRGVTRKTLLYVYPLSIDMVHCHYLTVLPLSFLCANLFLFKTPAKHLICNQNVEQTFCSIFSLPVPPNTHAGLCSCPSSRWAEHLSAEAHIGHADVAGEQKVIPGHPSSPSCHSPLRQPHFLSSSLGINSCIPA